MTRRTQDFYAIKLWYSGGGEEEREREGEDCLYIHDCQKKSEPIDLKIL
jgi:hypothetical protein